MDRCNGKETAPIAPDSEATNILVVGGALAHA